MIYEWLEELTVTVLEVINLLTIGISSYNIRSRVTNYIPAINLKIQENIKNIAWWIEKETKAKNNS